MSLRGIKCVLHRLSWLEDAGASAVPRSIVRPLPAHDTAIKGRATRTLTRPKVASARGVMASTYGPI
jgi:hypothetical protein